MTFEDLEQKFRKARPSASDLEPTEKTFELWDAVLESSTVQKNVFQPRKTLSIVATIIVFIALSAVLLVPKIEKTSSSTAVDVTTTSTTEVTSSPNSGFSFGTVRHAVELEVERINSLKSCLDTTTYMSLIATYLAETKFLNWQISSDTASQSNQCAFGKVLPKIQAIQVSYR